MVSGNGEIFLGIRDGVTIIGPEVTLKATAKGYILHRLFYVTKAVYF